MAKPQKIPTLAVVLGLLILLFVFKPSFLGSFVETCTNTEPIESFDAKLTTALEATVTDQTPEAIQMVLTNGSTYQYNLEVNKYDFLDDSNQSVSLNTLYNTELACSKYINLISIGNVSISQYYDSHKTSTIIDGMYYWCDPNDALIYRGSLLSYKSYIDHFIVCEKTEINDTQQKVDDCATLNALYNQSTDQCYCEDGSSFDSTIGCEETSTTTTATTSTSSSTRTKTSTSTTSTGTTVEAQKEWYEEYYEMATKGYGPLVIGAILILLVVYYFYYEKGPSRGLIRKKRRR